MARKIITIYFNDETDTDLIEFKQSCGNFSRWVRSKVRDEIAKKVPAEFNDGKPSISPELDEHVKWLIELKLATLQPTQMQPVSDEPLEEDTLVQIKNEASTFLL